jgi:hypothetical protein
MSTRLINKIGACLPLCLLGLLTTVGVGRAATIQASSVAYKDVSSAVALAKAGDTVVVPAGTATWTSPLTLSIGINLMGAGTNSTFITNAIPKVSPWGLGAEGTGLEMPPLIYVKLAADNPFRVSGFYFFCNWLDGGQGILVDQYTNTWRAGNDFIHGFRIDHCVFSRAYYRAVKIKGPVYGVVDHSYFIDCAKTVDTYRGDTTEWKRWTPPYYSMGTTNTTVIEDCTITYSAWMPVGVGAICSGGNGGHYVFRYNVVTNMTSGQERDGIDCHGNMNYLQNNATDSRGTMFFECYGNKFYMASDSYRSMNLRGGTCLVFSNSFFGAAFANRMVLDEEEAYSTDTFGTLRTTWPAQDQITNSYFWSNTLNGAATVNVGVWPVEAARIGVFIKEGRDYWTAAPSSFSSSAIKSYAPLIYPHPVVFSQDTLVKNVHF